MNKQGIEKAIDYFKNAHIDYSRVEDGIKAQQVCDLAITALTAQLTNGWILCKDRLPTPEEYQRNDCRFIVTDGNRVYEDLFDYMADGYTEPRWMYSSCQPIAWQNMPPRYMEATT